MFGITIADYNRMLDEQGGVCAICRKPDNSRNPGGSARDLAVDHCHSTGKIRGLLCADCNLTLGKMEDSIERIDALKAYLQKDD